MLDQITKRKIDSARQILVGKVPDPKAQVEQITTALVYKFMDDMDKESQELGGQTRFFANGFEKYSWTRLLDKRLSGAQRLDLYVQAITNMSKNPHIPQIFKDIFKGAALPYNDAQTLNLFLKEIEGFTFDHSEDLGDAYEYLLNVVGTSGEAGQFRTPRHIIDFIVEVVAPKKNETILDPAFGTAGFLISAYKHILRQHDGKNDQTGGPTSAEKRLSPEEKQKMMSNFVGYDIDPGMMRIAIVNMYLHHFPDPKIYEYDTLTYEDRWDDTFDVILANPPFMTPKGGIRPHKRFSVQATRSEVLFVDYILEHLNIKGRAGIIVPEGVIFRNDSAYKELRKKLVEDGLYAVVSLPQGVFAKPGGKGNVKTSILFFDNQLAKKSNEILFVKVENDGFDLGAQRRKIDKDEIAGWTDDESAVVIFRKPVVVFGDHTLAVKYLEKPFVQGADGIKILETNDKLLPKFLYFLLKNEPIKSDGYTRHFSKLKRHKIPLPPLEIQNEIVEQIEAKESSIKNAKEIIKNLERERRYFGQSLRKLKDVEWVKLGDVCKTTSGGTPLKSKREYYENGTIPWLKSGEVDQGLIYESEEMITEKGLKNSSAKIFPVNTVLLAMYGAT